MVVLKSVNFKEASINVVRYSDIIVKERHRVLSIDHSVSKIIQKNEMYKSIFKSNLGRYACSSSMKQGFKSNPMGIDAKAVVEISQVFNKILSSMSYYLSGWLLNDATNGYFVISWSARDDNFYEVDTSKLYYNVSTGKVSEGEEPFFGESAEPFRTIERVLPKILVSLQNIPVPVDLFEVCLVDEASSEEGQAGKFESGKNISSYILSGDIGLVSNSAYVLNGISVVSKNNGFNSELNLDGKYAVLVVQ